MARIVERPINYYRNIHEYNDFQSKNLILYSWLCNTINIQVRYTKIWGTLKMKVKICIGSLIFFKKELMLVKGTSFVVLFLPLPLEK